MAAVEHFFFQPEEQSGRKLRNKDTNPSGKGKDVTEVRRRMARWSLIPGHSLKNLDPAQMLPVAHLGWPESPCDSFCRGLSLRPQTFLACGFPRLGTLLGFL